MTSDSMDIIRRIESDVLDRHHEQFALLSRNEEVAIEAVLRTLAQVMRDLRTGQITKPTNDAKFETVNQGVRALARCMKWIQLRCPDSAMIDCPAVSTLRDEALELIRWGITYDVLFNQHVAMSRGQLEVIADEIRRTIEFLCPTIDPSFHSAQIESKKSHDERQTRFAPMRDLSAPYKEWRDSCLLTPEGFQGDDKLIASSGAIDIAVGWMRRELLPDLPDSTPLGEATLGEVRRVLAALYVYSYFVTELENAAGANTALAENFASRMVILSQKDMIGWICEMSGVKIAAVADVLEVLVFDRADDRVTVAQQPIVRSRAGRLFLLPRLLTLLDLPSTYLGGLRLCSTGKDTYSVIINTIEHEGLLAVAYDLAPQVRFAQLAVERRFRLSDDREIQPDLVLLSPATNEVLVIDMKFASAPFGAADVSNDIKDMAEWQERVGQYVRAFQGEPEILLQHFDVPAVINPTVFGLILLRWPLPVPAEFEDSVCAVDWPSLKDELMQSPPATLDEVFTWAKTRPDVPISRKLQWVQRQTVVGDWTYLYWIPTAARS